VLVTGTGVDKVLTRLLFPHPPRLLLCALIRATWAPGVPDIHLGWARSWMIVVRLWFI
jgi:hypothetical protein